MAGFSKLLCVSNGHGEDAIAMRIVQALQQHPGALEIAALPIVGAGRSYTQHQIPIIGPAQVMPSGGFIYMDGRQLARDLQGGLLQLTRKQLQAVRNWARQGGLILAVGDIVPLLFAWWSGATYAFVGTAKSDYYLQDEAGPLPREHWWQRWEGWSGSVYHPWERWFMSHPRCKAVFPRDCLTTQRLQQWSIPAFDLGNPMMDGLEPGAADLFQLQSALRVLLLPGSRPPEAYENWQRLALALPALVQAYPSILFLGAIAPGLNLEPFSQTMQAQDWQRCEPPPAILTHDPTALVLVQHQATLVLTQHAFSDCLHQADLAIAMAGTATEQFVGLEKPAILIPGQGPQFTPRFAESQTRLLGPSVTLVPHPHQVAETVKALLSDRDRLNLIAKNGQRRMGKPGAAHRIAQCLIEHLPIDLRLD